MAELDPATATQAVHYDEQLRPAEFRGFLQELFDGTCPAISKQIEEV